MMRDMRAPRLVMGVLAALVLVNVAFPPAAWADTPYVVQPGDTLSAIAARFSTSVSAIAAANGISNPNLIHVGQNLTIPGVTIVAAASSPVRSTPQAGPNSVLSTRRVLTYYGHPNSAAMGILGQLSPSELVAALKRRAAVYEALSDRPVQGAIHFIVTVAQAGPGADGKYRARSSMEQVMEYADLAAQNGLLMFIDIQVGLSTVQEELPPWIPVLRLPHVHLAIDPEFDMWPGQLPGEHIGHTTAAEINYAQQVLADIVEQNGLPNKMLMLHQFSANMLPDKQNIQSFARVDVITDMDGWGTQGLKLKHYQWYVADELVEFAAIKLFFDQDTPLFTPEQIMSLDPVPDVIVYQ